jgi:hypothetical protein
MEDIENICGKKRYMSNIFVCVPTMNDSEFLSTIERAYDNANNVKNISIGTTIFWKYKDISINKAPFFTHIEKKLNKKFKNVKYDIQPWHIHPGVGAGRYSPTKHFNNEKYFLSIDSHTEFVEGWDEILVDLYENSRKTFGKRRVLTAYLSPFEKHSSDEIANRFQFFDFYHNLTNNENYKLIFPLPNDKKLNLDNFKKLEDKMIDGEYISAKKISAHFYFTESDPWLVKYNLNLNKSINFWAEEFYQSCLSYARGYNLVWCKTKIMRHKYHVKDSRSYKIDKFKDISNLDEKKEIYKKYISKSLNLNELGDKTFNDNELIYQLLNKNQDTGYLSRSINGFLKYAGIDLVNRKTSSWWEVPEINVIYP